MQMPGRHMTNSTGYRYGFNGMEKDNEIKGEGNSLDFGARMYDSRLGRFLAVDPWTDKYPWQTTYAYHRNSPIRYIDWNGFGDPPPWYFRDMGPNRKPLLTLGAHNITLGYYQREDGASNFALNLVGNTWNGIAGTWNAAMSGVSGSELASQSLNAMEGMIERGANGESTQEDLENMTTSIIFLKFGPKVKSSMTGPKPKSVANLPMVDYVYDASVLSGKTRLGPNTPAQRYVGPWSMSDLQRAAKGQGPLDFVPSQTKTGKPRPLELHHADNMPGSAVHEVPPSHVKTVWHQKNNQGVTNKSRRQDTQLHWYMRGQEMGPVKQDGTY